MVAPGSENFISVKYQNTGDNTAYAAQSRLSAGDPFTSLDNIAYLGDIRPGDQVTARYQLSVDANAGPGNYSLDSEIRFRDTQDNNQISDTFRVPVMVVAPPASSGVLKILPAVAVIALIAIGAGYYLLVMRKKK